MKKRKDRLTKFNLSEKALKNVLVIVKVILVHYLTRWLAVDGPAPSNDPCW